MARARRLHLGSNQRYYVLMTRTMSTALYAAFDVFPRAKGSSSHIASMVRGLESVFGRVRLLCLGLPEMPSYQKEGGIEIFRYRVRHRDLLRRATGWARFVTAHTRPLRGQLALAVFRDAWSGVPVLDADPRCPAIFEVNALASWELSYSRPAFASNAALRAKLGDMERRCLRAASRVLCVSSVTRAAMEREGVAAQRLDTIPNVAHDVFFSPPARPAPIAALEDGDWFGYIGGLQPWQGVSTLIDGFGLVAPELPRTRLLILHGDSRGDLRDLHRRIARAGLDGRVLPHPSIPTEDVAAVLPRLRFTAAPLADTMRNTVQGCCPVKMVESMAAGVPVVASDLAACREWVRDEAEGLLAEPGDARAWALAIRRMFTAEEARLRMAAAARARAEQCFAWPVVHAKLAQTFCRAADEGGIE